MNTTPDYRTIDALLGRIDEIWRELDPLVGRLVTEPATFLETGAYTAGPPGYVDRSTAAYAANQANAVARVGELVTELGGLHSQLETHAAAVRLAYVGDYEE